MTRISASQCSPVSGAKAQGLPGALAGDETKLRRNLGPQRANGHAARLSLIDLRHHMLAAICEKRAPELLGQDAPETLGAADEIGMGKFLEDGEEIRCGDAFCSQMVVEGHLGAMQPQHHCIHRQRALQPGKHFVPEFFTGPSCDQPRRIGPDRDRCGSGRRGHRMPARGA